MDFFPPTPEKRFACADWQSLNALAQLIYQHQSPRAPHTPVDGHSLTASPLITPNDLSEQRVFTIEWLTAMLAYGPQVAFLSPPRLALIINAL